LQLLSNGGVLDFPDVLRSYRHSNCHAGRAIRGILTKSRKTRQINRENGCRLRDCRGKFFHLRPPFYNGRRSNRCGLADLCFSHRTRYQSLVQYHGEAGIKQVIGSVSGELMIDAVEHRTAWIFPALLGFWGIVCAFTLPPFQAPDENGHFLRACHLSQGRLLPDGCNDGWATGSVPLSAVSCFTAFEEIPGHPERKVCDRHFAALPTVPLCRDEWITANFHTVGNLPFVPYLPQAIGIAVARWTGGSALTALYMGRLANLLVAVILLHVSIRITPVFKFVLGATALLPMMVQQSASLSADGLTLSGCFLLVAQLLRLALGSDNIGWKEIVGLCASVPLVSLCKLPYAVLGALYLAIPPRQMGSIKRYLVIGVVLALMTLPAIGLCRVMSSYNGHFGEGIPKATVSASKQVECLRQRPSRLPVVLAATVAFDGGNWIEQLMTLGWLDAPVNPLGAKAYLLFLAFLALADRTANRQPSARLRLIALMTTVLGTGVNLTLLYLLWTPVGYPFVEGFQGRYLLPFLPLLLLLLQSRSIVVMVDRGTLLTWTIAAATAIQINALAAILMRYYPLNGMLVWTPVVAVFLGVGVFLAGTGLSLRGLRSGKSCQTASG
jgi:uncharacterized membrane protein